VKRLRVILSDTAVADILGQADWYESQADHKLAERWENAVTATLLRIAKDPGLGPVCQFKVEELFDVRRALVSGFPKHLVFYRFRDKELFILPSHCPWRS
jgi:plasmid stabilization system protein ParE